MPDDVIDRRALVGRHRVVMSGIDPRSPLSVGNGEFCFTADVTGLQTVPDSYPVLRPGSGRVAGGSGTLLGTQSQWGWHETPAPEPYDLEDSLTWYESWQGRVPYVDLRGSLGRGNEQGIPAAELWLRSNPHRLHLGMIGFVRRTDQGSRPIEPEEITEAEQILDLWQGTLTSRFRFDRHVVAVTTSCDPSRDRLAIMVDSEALRDGLAVRIAFPYGSEAWHDHTDWDHPAAHHTSLDQQSADRWSIRRTLDATRYWVGITGTRIAVGHDGDHSILITAAEDTMRLVISFDPAAGDGGVEACDPAAITDLARAHWAGFWSTGGAVELAHVSDPRALELERRIVLSHYLTAINCSGSMPPAETGLVCNSWRGKFHLEMHWWHAAHFPLWGRPELLRRSLRWYSDIMPVAQATAQRQGTPGARWPKQVGPEGRESPSTIGPFLIWQQPHPIYLAELLFRACDSDQVLVEFADLVFETARFMAGFAVPSDDGFELGPPLVPAQESYAPQRSDTANPTFELVYWHWALQVANRWRSRLGLALDPQWQEVSERMRPPEVRDGRYEAIGVEPWTIRGDHPSMLCALGVLPATEKISSAVMGSTLDAVLADWDWESTWGWDHPVIAMCAARLGRPELAVEALLNDQAKNTVLPNGHYRQSPTLPLYLPGNGGLLAAVAMMAGGWDDGPDRLTPGFPQDWPVRAEGLIPAP